MEESEYLTGQEMLLEAYSHLPILNKLEGQYAEQLLSMSKLRKYAPGEYITVQRDFDPWVYILLEGEVAVEIDGEEIASFNQSGEIFGEMVLIDESDRSASILTKTAVEVIGIDAVLIYEMEKTEQDAFFAVFFRIIALLLAQRLRNTNEEFVLLRKENRLI